VDHLVQFKEVDAPVGQFQGTLQKEIGVVEGLVATIAVGECTWIISKE
jgi:hypothetical protein